MIKVISQNKIEIYGEPDSKLIGVYIWKYFKRYIINIEKSRK